MIVYEFAYCPDDPWEPVEFVAVKEMSGDKEAETYAEVLSDKYDQKIYWRKVVKGRKIGFND